MSGDHAGRANGFEGTAPESLGGDVLVDEARPPATESSARTLSVRRVAGMMGEMSIRMGEVSASVESVQTQTGKAATAAEAAAAGVTRLGTAVSRINHIAHAICEIASMTPRLSLNASLDAAESGCADTSYAMVMGEVPPPAQRTRVATGEITQRLREITAAQRDVVRTVESFNEMFAQISGTFHSMPTAVEEDGGGAAADASEAAERAEQLAAAMDEIHEIARTAAARCRSGLEHRQQE